MFPHARYTGTSIYFRLRAYQLHHKRDITEDCPYCRGFSLDKSYFTQAEQNNIIHALQILKSSNYPDADKALNKVAGLFSHNMQSEWLEIDFSYWGSPEKERLNITALERAIINKYVITFTYFNSELMVTSQAVEPLKMVFKSHAWVSCRLFPE